MADTFHLYVGSEIGLFKAVNLTKKSWCNINKPSGGDRKTILNERQIETICWSNQNEDQICLGLTNQTVCIYDVTSKDFLKTYSFSSGIENDVLVGLTRYEEHFIICTKSNGIKVWTCDEEPECKLEIKTGQELERLRQNSTQTNLVATGGKQNDLKIWDLVKPTEPVFRAKNVRNDFLNLEVPIWVTDMAFLPDSNKVVTCTGHHQIRVYDPAVQRRPVIDIEWSENPLKALALHSNGYHIFVGDAHGDMALVDLRGKAHVVQKYKGGAGSIRSIQCHPSQDIVASCGLDRHLRIHDISSKKLLQKFYLKSKLNCLLFSSQCYNPNAPPETPSEKHQETQVDSKDSDDNTDNLWDEIEEIKTKGSKRKNQDISDGCEENEIKVTKKADDSEAESDSDDGSIETSSEESD